MTHDRRKFELTRAQVQRIGALSLDAAGDVQIETARGTLDAAFVSFANRRGRIEQHVIFTDGSYRR